MNKVGIIGAGLIGATLARKLAELGYEVKIANSKAPSTLENFSNTRITPAWAADAVHGVDVAILSIPQGSIASLSEKVRKYLREVPIVIDTGNYYPRRDGRIKEIDEGLTDSEWVAKQLGRSVVKAFNNIAAQSLQSKGSTAGTAGRVSLSVAGPAGSGKERVMSLIDELGFEPTDAGELDDSWRQQPGTPAYCADLSVQELNEQIASATIGDIPQFQSRRDATDTVAGSARQRRIMTSDPLPDFL